MPPRLPIADVVARLKTAGGVPRSPPAGTPFEQVLYDVASYLVSDERRLEVHRRLAREVGLTPRAVLGAPRETLLAAVEGGGMKPEMRADRVREAAEVAEEIGDLDAAARAPLPKAVRTFARFPSIGVPGAEKILLFSGAHAVPALESNGLRTLERLGFAPAGRPYAATYRAVREALLAEGEKDVPFWQRAHLLLRRHGQEVCRRSEPLCGICPLAPDCPVGRARVPAKSRGRG